jgi:hypothetical protein
MARLNLDFPQGFTARSEDRFTEALERVAAVYWHVWGKDNRYHSRQDTDEWRTIQGEYEALRWAAGMTPFPPGCSQPVPRHRANLLRLAGLMELNLRGTGEEWEDAVRGGRNLVDEHVDERITYGALCSYMFLIRDTFRMPHDMLPEQLRPLIEQARVYFREHAEETQAATPHRHAA